MSSLSTVQGQKYDANFLEEGGGLLCSPKTCVFVPSPYQLNLIQDGGVSRREKPLETAASQAAANRVCEEIDREKGRDWETTKLKDIQAREEADRTAFTPVQISVELMNRIRDLYVRSIDDNTPQGQARSLRGELKQIIRESDIFK